jgi:hypothetical protein
MSRLARTAYSVAAPIRLQAAAGWPPPASKIWKHVVNLCPGCDALWSG